MSPGFGPGTLSQRLGVETSRTSLQIANTNTHTGTVSYAKAPTRRPLSPANSTAKALQPSEKPSVESTLELVSAVVRREAGLITLSAD